MRRTLLSICLLFALSAPIATGAQTTAPSASPDPPEWADPFCSVSDQLIYWDTAKGHGTSDATKHLLGKLFAPGSSVAAHLILLTDTDAYEVQIGRQSLSGTEYFRSSARFLVEFPKDVQIKYSFVDSYKLDDGDEVFCPTEPRAFGKGKDSLAKFEVEYLPTYTATYKEALPVLPCGKPYVPATVTRTVATTGVVTDKPRRVQIAVYLDSKGTIVKTYVYRSSGVDYGDMRAMFAATHAQYAPATFLCTPIVGEYLYTIDYVP
jgi:hypothetical protein